MGMAFPAVFGLVYVAFGLLYVLPALFLNRYSSHIADLLRTNRMTDLELALAAQKSFWKFVGVFILVILCLYVLGIVAAIVIAVMR